MNYSCLWLLITIKDVKDLPSGINRQHPSLWKGRLLVGKSHTRASDVILPHQSSQAAQIHGLFGRKVSHVTGSYTLLNQLSMKIMRIISKNLSLNLKNYIDDDRLAKLEHAIPKFLRTWVTQSKEWSLLSCKVLWILFCCVVLAMVRSTHYTIHSYLTLTCSWGFIFTTYIIVTIITYILAIKCYQPIKGPLLHFKSILWLIKKYFYSSRIHKEKWHIFQENNIAIIVLLFIFILTTYEIQYLW